MSGKRKMVCLCWVLLEGGNAAAAEAVHLFPSPSSHRPGAGGRAMQALSGISKRVDVIATTDFWKEKKRHERTTMFCVLKRRSFRSFKDQIEPGLTRRDTRDR
jgi:hypothetical protein